MIELQVLFYHFYIDCYTQDTICRKMELGSFLTLPAKLSQVSISPLLPHQSHSWDIFENRGSSAYGNRNSLSFAVPGGPSMPLGGRFVSLGVCWFSSKFVGVAVVVAVVDLLFCVYAPLFCSAPILMGASSENSRFRRFPG